VRRVGVEPLSPRLVRSARPGTAHRLLDELLADRMRRVRDQYNRRRRQARSLLRDRAFLGRCNRAIAHVAQRDGRLACPHSGKHLLPWKHCRIEEQLPAAEPARHCALQCSNHEIGRSQPCERLCRLLGRAASLTWNSHERGLVRPIVQCANRGGASICPFQFMRVPSWYVPRRRHTFLLVHPNELYIVTVPAGLGPPTAAYAIGPLDTYVYPYDIASRRGPAPN
jgi:hypothetical protein